MASTYFATLSSNFFRCANTKSTIRTDFIRRTLASSSSLKDEYEFVKVERRFSERFPEKNGVGLITLNRPKALNALSDALFQDLIHAGQALDSDDEIGCMVLTGMPKAFAAGADISEMAEKNYPHMYQKNVFRNWTEFTRLHKPVIAAVSGFALGGGCELAMMCDIMVAGDNAQFGQPEINLGIIPGMGGTQRLVRAIGKSKAMHMVLTGERMSAQEAYDAGLVAKIYPAEHLVDEAVKVGLTIASKGRMATLMAKEAVNATDEMTLEEGLRFERRLFHSLFSTDDQKEGMSAFLEKREADFKHQ